jgi:DNA-binding IclR family transcriptional regulator
MIQRETNDSSVRTIDKAVTILETIASIGEDIDLATLSKKVKYPKSTTLRILNTLKDHNYITQHIRTKRFSLGVGLITLGKAAEKNFDIIHQVKPFLLDISEKTGETTSLAAFSGNKAVYIDQVISKSMIGGQPSIGDRLDLYCSASGKVLLSSLTDEQIHVFLRNELLTKKTHKTIVDGEQLMRELVKVREKGYAVDDEEVELGGRCIAVPLRNRGGSVVAAVSVMGPTTRITQRKIERIASLMLEDIERASALLGYQQQ